MKRTLDSAARGAGPRRPRWGVAVLGLLLLVAGSARADEAATRARAKVLYEEGMKRFNLGDYQDALSNFKQGYLVKPDPAFLFNLGQTYRMLDDPAGAAREYRAYLRVEPSAPNRPEIEKFIAAAEEAIKRKQAVAPPTGTIAPREAEAPLSDNVTAAPVPAPPVVESPVVAPPVLAPPVSAKVEAPSPDPTPAPTPMVRRWWLWAMIGAVAIIGVGIGIGVSYAVPKDAPIPSDVSASTLIHF